MPIRERNHRLERELYKGLVSISFTLCIQNRTPAFKEPAITKTFTEILWDVIEHSRCILPVYCFMPDHLHMLISGTSNDSDLWGTVVAYKQKTGFWLSRNNPEIKWQKDFYDHIIRTDESIGVQARYILDNPVRKGLTDTWQHYPDKGSIGCDLDTVISSVI